MKVVVLGGYGVFGGRLVQLLLRDGHDVWIGGRNLGEAQQFAARHGGHALKLDRRSDLAPILAVTPDVVVDAAGPFQAYGDDAQRLAAFCIEHGINYLDLSDDAGFTALIGQLNSKAMAAGRFALSGVSSVPALSSSVVTGLSSGLDSIEVIEMAILPGNRASIGRAAIAAILAQLGEPLKLWRGGQWRIAHYWSDQKRYDIANGFRRRARLVGVPDLTLFPAFFSARTVIFRAGQELGVLNLILTALAALRRLGLFRANRFYIEIAYFLSRLLKPLGSDVGAMVVAVKGWCNGQTVGRRWVLIVANGEGPFIPGIVVRTLLRNPSAIASGARACLSEATVPDIEAAMSDLAVTTSIEDVETATLFQTALQENWRELPAVVQRLHSVLDMERFSGRADIERGSSLLARFAVWLFRFPEAGNDVPVTVTMTCAPNGETWVRHFDGAVMRSHLTPSPRPQHFRERFWLFNYEIALPVTDNVLHMPVRRGWVLGIPMPKFLLPVSQSREFEADGRFHFDVRLLAPLTGALIVRYRGWLTPEAPVERAKGIEPSS